jgi:hypothetical protein
MILFKFRCHRKELATDAIGFRLLPIDQADDIGVQPNGHPRSHNASLNVAEQIGGDEVFDHQPKLRDASYRVFVLPRGIFEFLARHVPPNLETSPLARHNRSPSNQNSEPSRTTVNSDEEF